MRWGIQVCFFAELGDQQVVPSLKIGPPRDANYVIVLSLLEMHSGGNVRLPRCHPFSPGVLGTSDLILIYYWGGLCSAAPMDGGPCSTSTLTLEGGQCTGVHVTK